MQYIKNKSNQDKTHHFTIISLHFITSYDVEVIYVYWICLLKILHNSRLLCLFQYYFVTLVAWNWPWGGGIYTTEISKYYSTQLPFSLSPRAVVQHLIALHYTQSLPIHLMEPNQQAWSPFWLSPKEWSPFLTILPSIPRLCRWSASQVLQVGVNRSLVVSTMLKGCTFNHVGELRARDSFAQDWSPYKLALASCKALQEFLPNV